TGAGADVRNVERMLVPPDAQVAERALVLVRETGAADHLRAHQSGAVTASLAAKCLHAPPRHRGQHEARRNLDGADGPGRVQLDTHGKGIVAGRRTFSV